MIETLQAATAEICSFYKAEWKWLILVIISILGLTLTYAAHRRSKKEGKWKESIARKNLHIRQQEYRSRHDYRLFWQGAVLVAAILFFLVWTFRGGGRS